MTTTPTLDDAQQILEGAERLVERALDQAREITEGGRTIDDHQVLVESVAYAATEARAARETVAAVRDAKGEGRAPAILETTAAAAVALLARDLRSRLEPALEDLGLDESALDEAFPSALRATLRRAGHESVLREIGRHTAETRGREPWPVDDVCEQVRDAVREFAESEVAPEAERIHRNDDLVPESFISEAWRSSATSDSRSPRSTAASRWATWR